MDMITIQIPEYWAYIIVGLLAFNMTLYTINVRLKYKIAELDIALEKLRRGVSDD